MAHHRVLLVNDDGIHSEGIAVLETIVREIFDDVWIVAPDEEKSGAAHSISLSVPLRARQLGEKKFAVKGTPADCVILAYWELMKDSPPTIVLSGINHGENLGEDVLYSGTTGAAIESAALGLPSIALSQVRVLGKTPRLDTARIHTLDILTKLMKLDWKPGLIANVNFPDVDGGNVSGFRSTRLGRRKPGTFTPRSGADGRNVPYHWIKVAYELGEPEVGTDLHAIKEQAISITPLNIDMTHSAYCDTLKNHFEP